MGASVPVSVLAISQLQNVTKYWECSVPAERCEEGRGGIYKESTRSPQHSRAEFFEVSIYYLGTVWTDCEYWHGDTENGHNEMIRVCLSQWSLTPSQSMSSESGEHHYPSHQDNAKSIFNFSQNSSHIQPGNIFKLMNLKYGYWFFLKITLYCWQEDLGLLANITDILWTRWFKQLGITLLFYFNKKCIEPHLSWSFWCNNVIGPPSLIGYLWRG